jgi:hypothetical protein
MVKIMLEFFYLITVYYHNGDLILNHGPPKKLCIRVQAKGEGGAV